MPSNRNSYTLKPDRCWKRNTCWNRRNRLEKILISVVVVSLILVLILFIVLLVTSRVSTCTLPECVMAASSLLKFIDPTVDPCDNFYEFTCGTFKKNAHQTSISTPLVVMKDTVATQLAMIITEPTREKLPKSLRQQRKFYQACMNTTAIELDHNVHFIQVLEKLGGWPAMKREKWDEKNFRWEDVMVKSRKEGLTFSRFLEIGPCYTCGSEELAEDLIIKYPFISKKDKLERDLKQEYIDYMIHIAEMFGVVNANNELVNSVDFQEEFYDIVEKYSNRDANKTTLTIRELQETYPSIQWLEVINNLTLPIKQYRMNDTVAVDTMEYLDDLFKFLENKDKRIQSNYIIWELIETNIDFLTSALRDRKAKFELLKSQHLKQKKPDKTRKDLCIEYAKNLFPDVAEAAYVRKYIDKEKHDDIKYMLKAIRNDLRKRLQKVEWMDTATRVYAIEKLDKIKEIIGGPENVYNPEAYERFTGMDKLHFRSDHVIDMRNAAAANVINKYYRALTDSRSKKGLNPEKYIVEKPYTMINSYFAPEYQTIILSAGMLQGLFYDKSRPRYMNYGALGGVLGHEFTHGFLIMDAENVQKEGTNESWWSNITHTKFKEKSACVIDQYDIYKNETKSPFHQNGTVTLEENLADFNGANLAHAAYQEWVKKHGTELKLPGLKYTPNQLFWISYSSYMCFEKLREERRRFFRDNDTHGINSFRVVGPLRNSEEFANDFSCPVGSNMNPAKKCRLF